MGTNPALDKWWAPGTLGAIPVPAGGAAASVGAATEDAKPTTDPEIEGLDLAETAKKAAYELKKQHPSVSFTSGRRNKAEQARAMAGNIVLNGNRNWISETYASSTASENCQKWVDDNIEFSERRIELRAISHARALELLKAEERADYGPSMCGIAWNAPPEAVPTADGSPGVVYRGDTCNCQARIQHGQKGRATLILRSAC